MYGKRSRPCVPKNLVNTAPADAKDLLNVFDGRPDFAKRSNLLGPLDKDAGVVLFVGSEKLGNFLQLTKETCPLFGELHY